MKSFIFLVAILHLARKVHPSSENYLKSTGYLIKMELPNPCVGSAITLEWVLTAAHCCYKSSDPSVYRLVAERTGKYRRRGVSMLHIHPLGASNQPRSVAKSHDLALLKVVRSWNNEDVIPIILFSTSFPPFPTYNPVCVVAGWNRLGQRKDASGPAPSVYFVTTVSTTLCQHLLDKEISDNHLCVRDETENWQKESRSTYPCSGDNGGPLVCDVFSTIDDWWKKMLVGVMTSHDTNSNGQCSTGYYVDTGPFLRWIRSIVPDVVIEGLEPMRTKKGQVYTHSWPPEMEQDGDVERDNVPRQRQKLFPAENDMVTRTSNLPDVISFLTDNMLKPNSLVELIDDRLFTVLVMLLLVGTVVTMYFLLKKRF